MTKSTRSIGVGICPQCKDIHLMILDRGVLVASIPMSREEWAKLIGEYVEMQMAMEGSRVH